MLPQIKSGEDVTALMNQPEIKSGQDVTSLMNQSSIPEGVSVFGDIKPITATPKTTKPKEEKGTLGKVWDTLANKSVFGMEYPTQEELMNPSMDTIRRAGFVGLTTPLSLLGEGASALGLGIKALRGLRAAPKIADAIPSPSARLPKIAADIVGEQPIRTVPKVESVPAVTKEPTTLLEAQELGSQLPVPSPDPIGKLRQAIDTGIQKAKEQAVSYTTERATRIAKAKDVKTPGEAGYYEQLGHLKGQYNKLGMPPLRELIDQPTIDTLVDVISTAPVSDEFVKLHAKSALVKLLNGDIPQPEELNTLNSIFKTAIELPGQAKTIETPSRIRQVYELTRGLMSVDLPFMTSAAYRQGSGLAGTANWWRAYANNVKSFASEKVYNKIMDGLEQSPIHTQKRVLDSEGNIVSKSIADEIGLAQSDLKTLTKREEQIRSVLSEKIPLYGRWIRASNRGYTAFLNTLRTHTAEDWLKAYDTINDTGVTDMVTAKKIANTINELTGHGSLRIQAPFSRFTKSGRELNLERASDILSLAFFSPRLLARDARMMNPLNYMMTDKLMRMEYLKGAIRRAGVWGGFTTLAAINGAEVSSDITSSDFGKAKMGDTRLDAGTGLLQWLVLLGRQALGETTSSSKPNARPIELGSNAIAPSRTSLGIDFLTNRLHPTLGLALEAGRASKSRPFYPGSEIAERMLPMFTSDIVDLMKSDPETGQIFMGLIGAGASMGTMTYGQSREPNEPTFNIPGDVEFQGGKFLGR